MEISETKVIDPEHSANECRLFWSRISSYAISIPTTAFEGTRSTPYSTA